MSPSDLQATRDNVEAGIRMSLDDLEAIADRVVYLDWEPVFEAYGDGFLFSWESTDETKYVTPRRFVGSCATEKIVIDIMTAAMLEGVQHLARINFRVEPKGV